MLLSGRISPKLTSMSPTGKGVFPAIYRLSIETNPAVICKFLDWPVKAIVTVQMHSLLEQTDSRVYNMPLTVNILKPIFHQKANPMPAVSFTNTLVSKIFRGPNVNPCRPNANPCTPFFFFFLLSVSKHHTDLWLRSRSSSDCQHWVSSDSFIQQGFVTRFELTVYIIVTERSH